MTAAETAPEQPGTAVAVRPPRLPLSDYLRVGTLLVASMAAALGCAALLLSVTGSSPATVFRAMVTGSVGSRVALTATLNHAGPILLVALGALVATRSGLLVASPCSSSSRRPRRPGRSGPRSPQSCVSRVAAAR